MCVFESSRNEFSSDFLTWELSLGLSDGQHTSEVGIQVNRVRSEGANVGCDLRVRM